MNTELKSLRSKFIDLRAQQSVMQRDRDRLEIEGNMLGERKIRLEKHRALIQVISERTQKRLEFKISSLVSTALSAVFDDPEQFLVKFEKKYGKTVCSLLFVKNGREIDPIGFTGGGVLDITCFALRISFWSLKKTRPVFLIDEPFRNLHGQKELERCSDMVKMLSKELGLQFLMISDVELVNKEADKIFQIELANKESYINK